MKPMLSQLTALGAVPAISAPTEAIIASFTESLSGPLSSLRGINRQTHTAWVLGGAMIKK